MADTINMDPRMPMTIIHAFFLPGLVPNTFQIRGLCHPERSEGSLSGERSFAALRMTLLNRLRLTCKASYLKCIGHQAWKKESMYDRHGHPGIHIDRISHGTHFLYVLDTGPVAETFARSTSR